MFLLLLLVTLGLDAPPTLDWEELVQKPYVGLPDPDLGLRPLLVARDGKNITKKADWDKVRKALQQSWLAVRVDSSSGVSLSAQRGTSCIGRSGG